MGFFSSLVDPGNFFGGNEGGVNLTGIFDPGGTALGGAGAVPDWYTDTNGKIDDWASDIHAFEKSNFSDMFKKFKNDPTQLLIGAGDPFSAKMWSGITGKDYTPYVNQMGGPSNESYASAERKGVDTSNSLGSHQVAGAIAGMYGGAGLGSGLGAAGSATGIGSTAGQALGGAAVGAGNAWANDGNVWQGALSGGLGGYLQGIDYSAGLGGIDNEALRKGFNGAVGGGLNAGLSGDSVGEGALLGGAKGAAGGLYNMYGPGSDFPDQGTLGGNMRGDDGEVSTPEYTTPQQANANTQAQGLSGTYGTPEGFRTAASYNAGPTETSSSSGGSSVVDNFISALGGAAGKLNSGNIGEFASQAMGLYDANRQRRKAKEQASALNNLYSPNSPYAQQMRQKLERQDAASGRRSQSGVREVELAARLADSQARMAPQLNQLYGQESQARNRALSNGLRIGQGLYKLYGN